MATAQAESTIPTGIWQSDPVHSSVGFAVKHMVGTFRGSFGEFEARCQRRLREAEDLRPREGGERPGEGGEPLRAPPLA